MMSDCLGAIPTNENDEIAAAMQHTSQLNDDKVLLFKTIHQPRRTVLFASYGTDASELDIDIDILICAFQVNYEVNPTDSSTCWYNSVPLARIQSNQYFM
jgi:hypothetical protein